MAEFSCSYCGYTDEIRFNCSNCGRSELIKTIRTCTECSQPAWICSYHAECSECSEKATVCEDHGRAQEETECAKCGEPATRCIDHGECRACTQVAVACEDHNGAQSCGEGISDDCDDSPYHVMCNPCFEKKVEGRVQEILEERGIGKSSIALNTDETGVTLGDIKFDFGG